MLHLKNGLTTEITRSVFKILNGYENIVFLQIKEHKVVLLKEEYRLDIRISSFS